MIMYYVLLFTPVFMGIALTIAVKMDKKSSSDSLKTTKMAFFIQ